MPARQLTSRPRAEDKDLSFTLDCTGVTHSMVRGDKEKLGRLVSCLAGNAVTYTRPGGRVSVTLVEGASPRAKGRRTYRLIVADTGVGMPGTVNSTVNACFHWSRVSGSVRMKRSVS